MEIQDKLFHGSKLLSAYGRDEMYASYGGVLLQNRDAIFGFTYLSCANQSAIPKRSDNISVCGTHMLQDQFAQDV